MTTGIQYMIHANNGLSRAKLALQDIYDGLSLVHIWSMLAWQEIRARYRRSILGPFWLTLSTGILIGHFTANFSGKHFLCISRMSQSV